MIWKLINEFVQSYRHTITGRYDKKGVMINNEEGARGGSDIKMGFYKLYSDFGNYNAC